MLSQVNKIFINLINYFKHFLMQANTQLCININLNTPYWLANLIWKLLLKYFVSFGISHLLVVKRSKLYSSVTSSFLFPRAFRKSLANAAAAELSLSLLFMSMFCFSFSFFIIIITAANCLHVVPTCATFELAISTQKPRRRLGRVVVLRLVSALFYVINNMFCSGTVRKLQHTHTPTYTTSNTDTHTHKTLEQLLVGKRKYKNKEKVVSVQFLVSFE